MSSFMIFLTDFPVASALAALEAAERKVMTLQRFIKRIVEREIFYLVLRWTEAAAIKNLAPWRWQKVFIEFF